MEYAIFTNQLCKQYDKHLALDHVNLHIKKGEIYGFIGRNGAGKTTCMRILCGLSAPTEGEISLFGHTGNQAKKYLSRIGCLIETPGLYPGMTAYENLKCKCIFMGIHKQNYIEELLELVGLSDTGKKIVKKFSLGMKQRLGIAMALVGEPDILILDEPTNGLDPQGISQMRQIILKLKNQKNMTIMISSHILEEVSKIADRYGIVHQGKLIQELSREELEERCSDYIQIKTQDSSHACVVLDKIGITHYKAVDKKTIYVYEWLDQPARLNRELVMGNCLIEELSIMTEELENYFLELTKDEENVGKEGF